PIGEFDDVLRTQGADDRIVAAPCLEDDPMSGEQRRDVDGVVSLRAENSNRIRPKVRRDIEIAVHLEGVTAARAITADASAIDDDLLALGELRDRRFDAVSTLAR